MFVSICHVYIMLQFSYFFFFFFFNDTATTEIYTLSLHDALPICNTLEACSGEIRRSVRIWPHNGTSGQNVQKLRTTILDRKSTRLNSSHLVISYAVFCLKKKKKKTV